MRKMMSGLVLIVLLAVALTACGEPALGPKETAEAFLSAMEGRDFLAAYELLSADTQATITSEDFAAMMKNAWDEAQIVGFHVESIQDPILASNGTRASVPYAATLTTADGESDVIYNAFSLVLQEGHWCVIWPPVR